WNEVPGSIDKRTERRYGEQKPAASAELYVIDRPGQAFTLDYGNDCAKNISLEFRTCIYREKDVPLEVSSPSQLDFATPIQCHDWNSSFIFDHQTRRYESPEGIDPFCTKS